MTGRVGRVHTKMFQSFKVCKVTEKDIREWLSVNGYYGGSARFGYVELHAIDRPGWLQVFRFQVTAKDTEDRWHELHGAVRDDERYGKPFITVFAEQSDQAKQLAMWSGGLIVRRTARASRRKVVKPAGDASTPLD